ncbi:hypothetical protein D3C78_1927150 [compost metagenome]
MAGGPVDLIQQRLAWIDVQRQTQSSHATFQFCLGLRFGHTPFGRLLRLWGVPAVTATTRGTLSGG